MKSRTQKALALVRGGMTAYAAAKQVGLSNPTVYKAVQAAERKASRQVCPTCHRPLKTPLNAE